MSQPTEAQADIVERLTAMYSHRGDGLPTQYVNPDGREAAAEITRLRAELAEARIQGRREGLEAGARVVISWRDCDYSEECNIMADSIACEIRTLDPATLMKDADHG